jgi:hypothetical protein
VSGIVVRPSQPPAIVVSGGGGTSPSVTLPPEDDITISMPTGQPGPRGPTGPAGPPGDSAAALSYVHVQGVPSDNWVIMHPLAYFPNITVVDSTGTEVEGDVTYTSASTVTVSFSGAFSGTAYLS